MNYITKYREMVEKYAEMTREYSEMYWKYSSIVSEYEGKSDEYHELETECDKMAQRCQGLDNEKKVLKKWHDEVSRASNGVLWPDWMTREKVRKMERKREKFEKVINDMYDEMFEATYKMRDTFGWRCEVFADMYAKMEDEEKHLIQEFCLQYEEMMRKCHAVEEMCRKLHKESELLEQEINYKEKDIPDIEKKLENIRQKRKEMIDTYPKLSAIVNELQEERERERVRWCEKYATYEAMLTQMLGE